MHSKKITYLDSPVSDEDKTVFELHITSTVLNDSATYACKISNEFGDDVHNIELTILGKCELFIVSGFLMIFSRFMIFSEVFCFSRGIYDSFRGLLSFRKFMVLVTTRK